MDLLLIVALAAKTPHCSAIANSEQRAVYIVTGKGSGVCLSGGDEVNYTFTPGRVDAVGAIYPAGWFL